MNFIQSGVDSIRRCFGRSSHHRFDQDEEVGQDVGSVTGKKEEGTLKRIRHHFLLILQMLPYLWPKGQWGLRLRVVVAVTCLIASKVLNVLTPFAYKRAIDEMTKEGKISFPWLAILGYGCGSLLGNFLNNFRDVIFVKVQNSALRDVSLQLFTHLHSLSISYHLTRKTGGVLRGIDRGTRGISFLVMFLLFNIAPIVLELFMVCFVLIIRYIPWISIITFCCVVIYIIYTIVITEWRTKYRRDMNKFENDANDKAVDSLLNYETVKYFGAEEHEAERYRNALDLYTQQAQKSQSSLAVLNVGQSAIIAMGQLGVNMLTAYQVSKGKMTVGDFVMINTFILQLYTPLNFLGTSYRMIKQSLVDMENMFDILKQEADVKDAPDAVEYEPKGGEVIFEDVHFKYKADSEDEILKGVSFKIRPGKQLAIVGPSGSGKTTINRLLFRFYDPTAGRILVDGQDITHLQQGSLRRQIGIVPQDSVLFNDTIRYNINYGNFEASEAKVVEAAEISAILAKIENQFDKGWETIVGERGTRLSGGEKQRVSIARCVLKNPPIIVFDEATSSLDSTTERDIQDKLREVFKGKTTTIVLAHRLSTIVDSDEIIVLKEGVIAEQGTHEELLQIENGFYRELWEKQSSKHVSNSNLVIEE